MHGNIQDGGYLPRMAIIKDDGQTVMEEILLTGRRVEKLQLEYEWNN